MNYVDTLKIAQEEAAQNKATVLVCTDDGRAFWTVNKAEAHWFLGDGSRIVKRVEPPKANA